MDKNDKVEQDMQLVQNIGVFLKQDRNGNHLSAEDLEKAKTALATLQRRLSRYEKKEQ